MIIYQHNESDGLRLELTCLTKNKLGHKLISESDGLANSIKHILSLASDEILALMKQELTYRKSQGLQVED